MTPEGIHVASALDRPGIWRRAGLGGLISGMDVAEALAALPARLDPDLSKRLLVAAERHYVTAHLEHNAEPEKS